MNSPGVDLLLRVVADQLGDTRCSHCRRPLADARVSLRKQQVDGVVVEVICGGCRHQLRLRVKPEANPGPPRGPRLRGVG